MRFILSKIIILTILLCFKNIEAKPFDIVFDLDWTLLYSKLSPDVRHIDKHNIFEHEGEFYRLSDDSLKLLAWLHQQKNVRVSFFSGGEKERNTKAIDFIYKRLLQEYSGHEKSHPFVVGHKEDLEIVNAKAEKFTDRYKKNLPALFRSKNKEFQEKNLILIDDSFNFASPNTFQIWLGKTYEDIPRASLIPATSPQPYIPSQFHLWDLERNKMNWILGLLERTFADNEITEKSLQEILSKNLIQDEKMWVAQNLDQHLNDISKGKAIPLHSQTELRKRKKCEELFQLSNF